MATSSQSLAAAVPHRSLHTAALRWSATLLIAASWASAAIFGAYIILFFGGMMARGTTARWNEALPALYDGSLPLAALALGPHFVTGGILLLLGPIQLIGAVRRAVPTLHRWVGRAYVLSAGLAGFGGLGFIVSKGTIGGPLMNAGFGLYGVLMILAAVLAYAHARAGRYEAHRAWAIRLYALTVGSWLYRMGYGFGFLAIGKLGHTSHFTGWFDAVMVFFFYLPNLAVAELFIRARDTGHGSPLRAAAAMVLLAASAFVIVATWSFTTDYWGPGMVSGVTGAARTIDDLPAPVSILEQFVSSVMARLWLRSYEKHCCLGPFLRTVWICRVRRSRTSSIVWSILGSSRSTVTVGS